MAMVGRRHDMRQSKRKQIYRNGEGIFLHVEGAYVAGTHQGCVRSYIVNIRIMPSTCPQHKHPGPSQKNLSSKR
jgi:hypothetical protein